jgi:biotin carboxyl carrier protein
MTGCVLSLALPSSLHAQLPPSVEFRVPKPPTVAVTDSGAFVVYEIHVTNLAGAPLAVRRVDVLDADKKTTSLTLSDGADSSLFRATAPVVGSTPRAERLRIQPGQRSYIYIWLPVDAQHPPARLTNRLTVQQVPRDTSRRFAGDTASWTLDGTAIPVTPKAVVIGPPIRGEWAAFNGPGNASGHRRLVLALDGHVASGQRFAIDYLQVDSAGSSRKPGSDPLKNESYYAYGNELLAVADGIVAATKDGIPQNVPGANSRAVTITLETVGGNFVGIDIGGGYYALYAHVQPGSLRVKVGDHVKRGQVVALLGNSGNSTEPHVHFQVADAPNFLASEGVPYATNFDVVGRCGIVTVNNQAAIRCTRGTPVPVKGGEPLQNELVRFP